MAHALALPELELWLAYELPEFITMPSLRFAKPTVIDWEHVLSPYANERDQSTIRKTANASSLIFYRLSANRSALTVFLFFTCSIDTIF